MTQTVKTPRNWTRIVLVVSLALNLAVVGMVAGFAFSGGPKGGPARFDLTAGPLTRAMDDDMRGDLRRVLRDSPAFERRNRGEMRADMVELVAVLRAEAFDSAAFRDALTRQRERLQQGQETVLAVVTEQISTMTPDERRAFADRLEAQLRRGEPRGN